MHRRRFLKSALSFLLAAAASLAGATSRQTQRMRCFVAGVRYHDIDPFALSTGYPVRLRRSMQGGQPCYEVICGGGTRIGYVPRHLVPAIEGRRVREAFLSAVRPHALPWKQVEVEIVVAS